MNKTVRKIFSFFILITMLFSYSSIFASGYETDKKISVIITIDNGAEACSVKEEISKALPQAEYKDEYSTFFNGFCVLVHESQIPALKSIKGVEAVYSDTEYSALSADEDDYTLVYAPGLEPDYFPSRGAGSVVAVLDNGFYLRHELFTLADNSRAAIIPKDVDEILHFTKASRLKNNLYGKFVYKNEKIPFAFDYADGDTDVSGTSNHGTAMLSLAAGNPENSETLSAAPSAQVLAMKIYSDHSDTAKTSTIIAALEDAYVLGADAVCLSLGSPCGFSEYGLYDTLLERTIDKLYNKGVTVVCAAGNDSALGAGSLFDRHYGYFEPLTSLPDSGTVSAPSTSYGALSVASADTFLAHTYAFKLYGSDTYIPYSDSNSTVEATGNSFYSLFDTQSLEYVIISGLGKKEDFIKDGKTLDLTGKIALIERGELTFTEKVNNAAECGAIAAIIYDNGQSNSLAIRTSMQLDGALIPAVLISKSDGEFLKNNVDKRIYIDSKIKYVTNAGITPSPSEFSSRGPTPTLDIKPELASAGTDVAVANKNGSYSTLSGTSASAAYTAGLAAAVSAGLDMPDDSTKADKVKAILMNSAAPMRKVEDNEQRYFSVTLQGAGYLSQSQITEPEICVTSDSQAKILLGNDIGEKFEIPLTLENLTEKAKNVELAAVIGSESYETLTYGELCSDKDSFYKKNGRMLYEFLGKDEDDTVSFTGDCINELSGVSIKLGASEINQSADSFTGASITLAPREILDVTLSVDLSSADLGALKEVFENGMIIQGYVFAKAENTYSIPLLGSFGDLYTVDPFDSLLSEKGGLFGGTYLYTYFADNFKDYMVILGTNYDITGERAQSAIASELAVISPVAEGAEGSVFLRINLLRNLKSLKADIYSSDGKLITSAGEKTDLKKAFLAENKTSTASYFIELWNCRDKNNEKFIYDDGEYICKLTGVDASDREFTKEFPFCVDSEKPELAEYEVRKEHGEVILNLTVKDNTYIREVSAVAVNDAELYGLTDTAPDDELLKSLGVGGEFGVSFDITDYAGQYIYVEIVDLAFNKSLVRIKV